jgi:DNA-binding NarL/FixJ family response regulator
VSPAPARILVADADAPTRAGLRLALRTERLEIVSETEDAASALAAARELAPDVALVASDLPGGGLGAVRMIAAAKRATRIIVLSADANDDELLGAVLAGAVGYLSKGVDPLRLPAVIEGVIAGEVALPRHLSRRLLEEVRGRHALRARVSELAKAPLSAREWEVLHMLGAEVGTGEMARRLGISDVTVRRHVSSVVAKLGVADRKSAVRLLRSAE